MRNQVENYYGSLDVPTEKFLFFAFTHMPGDSNSDVDDSGLLLLYSCYIFQMLINSLVCRYCASIFIPSPTDS